MKRICRFMPALALLALLLAGCGGDFASPTYSDNDSTTYTTTTTAGAELAQENNRPVCVGLVVLGSCNTTAAQSQHVNRTAGAPAPTPGAGFGLEDVVKAFIIAGMITALFVMLMTGLRWIFPSSDDGAFLRGADGSSTRSTRL
jgi:hypothetical protein